MSGEGGSDRETREPELTRHSISGGHRHWDISHYARPVPVFDNDAFLAVTMVKQN